MNTESNSDPIDTAEGTPVVCVCSNCGSAAIREVDRVLALVTVKTFKVDGRGHVIAEDFGDDNGVDWNSQRIDDEDFPFVCRDCDAQLCDRLLPQAGLLDDGTGWLVRAEDFAELLIAPAVVESAPADVAVIRNALAGADDFIAGFDGDESQEPGSIETMQNDIAAAFGEVSKLVDERDAWTAQRAALLHGVESAAQTITESSARETRQAKALSIYTQFCMAAAQSLSETLADAARDTLARASAAQVGQ
jgi:hypothetical protein